MVRAYGLLVCFGVWLGLASCAARPAAVGEDAGLAVCPALDSWQLGPFGCASSHTPCPSGGPSEDQDGDGFTPAQGDCDDATLYVSPAAAEVCDLRDNDCDGEVDEGCPDPAAECPVSYADIRCCDARHQIAGTFYELDTGGLSTAYSPGNGFDDPYVVLVVRADTGEQRVAATCPAPPRTPYGFPFRFVLRDDDFVQPGVNYQLLIHLRWYFPWAATQDASCYYHVPVVTTDTETAAVCIDYGPLVLACL